MRQNLLLIALLAATTSLAPAAAQVVSREKNTPEKSADPGDKVLCKTFPTIGSLIANHRICKTKREWDQERRAKVGLDVSDSCATRATTGCN